MVDAVVSLAVEKLGDVLIGETSFLLGVRSQVKRLRAELIRMECFLKDADAKEQQGNESVRHWVAEIRNIAYDAEDVIDSFVLKVDSARKTKTKSFLSRKALMVKNLKHLRRVGNEIQSIQARLRSISDSTITYGIQNLRGNGASSSQVNEMVIQRALRNRNPHVEDNDVVGFEEHTKTLLTELMKDDEQCCVISIVGVGGLGKTTLAKKIYRHDTVKSHFDCCGWSSISQQLNVKDVLREIIKKCMSLTDRELSMSKGDLMEKLYNYLQDKRYFVVLDDVWKIDHWDTLTLAFPVGKRGSKILLTTRNKEVALHADPWSLHFEPQLLTDEESWELLCKKVFPKKMVTVGCYPASLEKLGREMVRKCGGLPLGICVLGGLLATKRSERKQWELVHRDVISHINRAKGGGVNGILSLSYHDLPSHLKPCFLYLGLFPEDCDIPRKKLVQLWIAEGFIPQTEENAFLTMEDIGKHQYLEQLSQRCMVQLGKGFDGSICRIHDLMRDLCLSKAKEINFLGVYNLRPRITGDIQTSHPVTTGPWKIVRRYATHVNNADISKRYDIHFNKPDCAIRTLFVILPYASDGFPLAPINYQNIKLLRVLDLGNVGQHKTDITKQVSKLIHLRYLDLGNLSGCCVSSSIGNLQTLRLIKYRGNLPETTSELVQLRHLNLFKSSVDQKFRIENLINLQTIDCIEAGKWIRKGCLEKLLNLRKLSVHDTTQLQIDIIVEEMVGKRSSISLSSSSSSSSDVQNQIPIKSLIIHTREGFPKSIFDSLSCCHNLHRMHLKGSLDIINLQKFPQNIAKLYLQFSIFIEDPMATLQHLPNLSNLELFACKYGKEEMVCSSKGLPQLQYLVMFKFENVKEWRVSRGGMPHLKELRIDCCTKLSKLPEGLRFITTLEKLKIGNMPLINKKVAEGVGEDWHKVEHIPSIITYP
ncbi:hypothetical protein MKX03_010597 [Papaver bracteatum]|nr:hypothetical protein MKX03_010597 [Papaver bracteatum]